MIENIGGVGGVAILIADRLHLKPREDIVMSNTETESCFAEVKTHSQSIVVGRMYRPSNTPPNEFVKSYGELMKRISREGK